jgi:hypothetical protein
VASILLCAGLSPVVRRLLASLLIVLALSPFTAPFCTCDLSTLAAEYARSTTHFTTFATASAVGVDASSPLLSREPPASCGRPRFFVSSILASVVLPSRYCGVPTRAAAGVRAQSPLSARGVPLRLRL